MSLCYVNDCNRPNHAHGLCVYHYDREYKTAIRSGRGWDSIYIDGTPFRKRIQEFVDAGYSFAMMEAVTGIERNTFQRQLTWGREMALEYHVDKLARTPLVPVWELWKQDIGLEYQVPKYLATRRVRSLLAYGWEMADISKASGISRNGILRIYRTEDNFVMRSNLVRIDKAFRELSVLPKPDHMKTHRVKKFQGYPVPFEWDDIDNPDGEKKASRRARNRLRSQESRTEVGAA